MKVTIMVSLGSRTLSVQEDSWEAAEKALGERLATVGSMLADEQATLDEIKTAVGSLDK